MATHLRPRLGAARIRLAAWALCLGGSGLAGCPDTELNACYEDTECAAGTVCSPSGRCAPPTGLDASVDGGRLDASVDGGRLDGGRLDASVDGGRLDGGRLDGGRLDGGRLDGQTPDDGVADRGAEVSVDRGLDEGPEVGPQPDAGLPTIACEVRAGAFNPALQLSPEAYGYDLLVTEGAQGPRVVRAVGRPPVAGGGSSEDGQMVLYCAPLARIDSVGDNRQVAVGATTTFSDGRPMVRMVVSEPGTPGARLHVGWWIVGPENDADSPPRAVHGVTMALDEDGCPLGPPEASWEVPGHRYGAAFDLAWLEDGLRVSVGRPLEGDAWRQHLVPISNPVDDGIALLDLGANQLALVGAASGQRIDAFASGNNGAGEIALHALVGFDEIGPLRLDADEFDDGRSALSPARLLAAVASEPGRFGVLSQLLPIVENPGPPCEGEGGPYPETNGTPQQLQLQVVQPGRGEAGAGEVVFQVFGTPTPATGDPLYADLAWHEGQRHYAVAYLTHHGSRTGADLNGVRLAVLDATGEVQQHLSVASYQPSCQTLAERPLVVPTSEGFLVTWRHQFSYLRHARITCELPER